MENHNFVFKLYKKICTACLLPYKRFTFLIKVISFSFSVLRSPPYKVSETGYGGFILPIEIYFKTNEEPRKAAYVLKYYYLFFFPTNHGVLGS